MNDNDRGNGHPEDNRQDLVSDLSPEKAEPPASGQRADDNKPPTKLLGAGLELASFSLVCGALGYGVDGYFGFKIPYVALLGFVVGFTIAMVRLIRTAEQLFP